MNNNNSKTLVNLAERLIDWKVLREISRVWGSISVWLVLPQLLEMPMWNWAWDFFWGCLVSEIPISSTQTLSGFTELCITDSFPAIVFVAGFDNRPVEDSLWCFFPCLPISVCESRNGLLNWFYSFLLFCFWLAFCLQKKRGKLCLIFSLIFGGIQISLI